MKVSSKFFGAMALGLCAALGLNFLAFWLVLGIPTETSRWAWEIGQRKSALAAQASSPRLLLVGGSSVLFGINAADIQRESGWATINLGTHAALGTRYLLSFAKKIARPGDTVLLALEYELYDTGDIQIDDTDDLFVDYLVARDAEFFHDLPVRQQWDIFMLTSFSRLKIGLRNRFHPASYPPASTVAHVYNVIYLNENGDQTDHAHTNAPARLSSIKPVILGRGLSEHPLGFPVIASFCQWAKSNHIRVLATYPATLDEPPLRTALAQKSAERIVDFFAAQDVPVVGNYLETLLPREDFFDTVYHLTEQAAHARTAKLARQLKMLLGDPSAPQNKNSSVQH